MSIKINISTHEIKLGDLSLSEGIGESVQLIIESDSGSYSIWCKPCGLWNLFCKSNDFLDRLPSRALRDSIHTVNG